MDDITIEHALGRDGAKDRLVRGLVSARKDLAQVMTLSEERVVERWIDDYTLHAEIAYLGATCSGLVKVEEHTVRIVYELPALLSWIKPSLSAYFEKEARPYFSRPA